jgi:transcription factor SFP1
MNALSAMEREDELVSATQLNSHFSVAKRSISVRSSPQCRNYSCCGLNLQDLHALVDHFEECHVVVVDPCAQPDQGQHYSSNFSSPTPNPKFDSFLPNSSQVPRLQHQLQQPQPQHQHQHHHHHHQQQQQQQQHHHHQQQHPLQLQHQQQGPFDPDDMELDLDSSPASSSASSPPLTPVTTPLVPYTAQRPFPNASAFTPLSLSQPSSECPSPVSAFDTTTVLPSRASTSTLSAFSSTLDSFGTFSGYPDYGAVTSPLQSSADGTSASGSQPGSPYSCVPPTLLYSPCSITPANTPSNSRVASPVAAQGQTQASYHPLSAQASTSASGSSPSSPSPSSTPRASTTLSRPASSLLLSKPFRCPKANCNKSYKQANGLKYHMTHGSCNFAPPKDLEALQALLAEKGVMVNGNDRSGVQITEGELREVEREAERRLRPFACGVGDCQRRYKNMNGLRASNPFKLDDRPSPFRLIHLFQDTIISIRATTAQLDFNCWRQGSTSACSIPNRRPRRGNRRRRKEVPARHPRPPHCRRRSSRRGRRSRGSIRRAMASRSIRRRRTRGQPFHSSSSSTWGNRCQCINSESDPGKKYLIGSPPHVALIISRARMHIIDASLADAIFVSLSCFFTFSLFLSFLFTRLFSFTH